MPIPLVHDVPVEDMPFRQCRMLHSDLPGSDPKRQNLWWRKQLRTVDGETRGPWVDMLCFQEVEWQTLDFYVLLTGLGSLGSWLNTRVICLRFIPGTEQRPVGYYYIWGNILYRLLEGKVTVLEIFYTERDRTQALQRWFNITLTEQEKEGIIGWNTELKHGGDEYDYYGG